MLPFDFYHGSVFFQRCMEAVGYIMHTFGYPNVYKYIDDLVYTGHPIHIYRVYTALIALIN